MVFMDKNRNRVFERSGGFFTRIDPDGTRVERPIEPVRAPQVDRGDYAIAGLLGVVIVLFWYFLRYINA